MTKNQVIKHWQNAAQRNLKDSNDLFKTKHYDWSLFLGHLALEKLIKGLIVKKTNKNPKITHNLTELCKQAQIDISQEQISQLNRITSFNLEARYDAYKKEFYKLANEKFTTRWHAIIKQIFTWIKKNY